MFTGMTAHPKSDPSFPGVGLPKPPAAGPEIEDTEDEH
jgi:hypothetical protein